MFTCIFCSVQYVEGALSVPSLPKTSDFLNKILLTRERIYKMDEHSHRLKLIGGTGEKIQIPFPSAQKQTLWPMGRGFQQ